MLEETNTILEIVFTGIGSAIFSIVVYFYKNWRKTVNKDKQIYQNYLWWLQLNNEIIKNMKHGQLPIENACSQFHLLEPYTLNYIEFFDDSLRVQMLAYDILIQGALVKKVISSTDLNQLEFESQSIHHTLSQRIKFIDEYIGKFAVSSFILFFALPPLIKIIANKYLIRSNTDNKK